MLDSPVTDFPFVITDDKIIANEFNDTLIDNLINYLNLPPKMGILFKLEAARLQVFFFCIFFIFRDRLDPNTLGLKYLGQYS